MNEIQKGPFWVVCGKISDETSFHRTELLCYPVSVNTSPSLSHIDVWKEVYPGYKQTPWNYYPRGRVEIRYGKAIVYANPICFMLPKFEKTLREKFNLGDIELVYKADNSKHYQYGIQHSKNAKRKHRYTDIHKK